MCIDLFLRVELLDLKIITLFIFQFSFLSALLEHFYWRPWIIMIEDHRIFLAETFFLIWSRKWYLIYICIPILIIFNIFHQGYYRSCIFSFFLNFINIVLVLPYINMNPPQVYTCSPSWTLLPPPHPVPSLWVVPVHQQFLFSNPQKSSCNLPEYSQLFIWTDFK